MQRGTTTAETLGPLGGPHDWSRDYRLPMCRIAIDFLRTSARERLDHVAAHGGLPLLSDIYISRLVAALDAMED